MAKKFLLAFIVQMCCLVASGKTTYIAKYRSYIHIVNGTDTVSVEGYLPELEMTEDGGLFAIRIEHEEVTQEKVKAIKRAKARAGWMAFSAVMSSVSTAFSNNSLQYYIRSTNTRISTDLATIYAANAVYEQKLAIDLWIDNLTESELMVNDMERGLTWYILPKQSAQIMVNNPEAACLRISDIHHNDVRYVMAAAGSTLNKWEVAWEDDECWVVEVYKTETPSDAKYSTRKYKPVLSGYRQISKTEFYERDMSPEEFNAKKKNKRDLELLSNEH